MANILGILVSVVFVFVTIGISGVLAKKNIMSNEGTRKFIHIGVANWWFIAMYFFDKWQFAILVPALFVVVNYISYKKQVFSSMERSNENNSPGTVYYAISLLILSFLTFREGSNPVIGLMGILVMGYGDGLAAVIGQTYGRYKFQVLGASKSLEGSLAMFISSFIVAIPILYFSSAPSILLYAIIISLAATAIELFSIKGLDNLTVPLLTSLLYFLLVF